MGLGDGSGGHASDREQPMKLRSLACCSPPAVQPGGGGVGDPCCQGI